MKNKIPRTDTLIIYHQVKDNVDCPDGITSAWVAFHKLCQEVNFKLIDIIGWTYDRPLTESTITLWKKELKLRQIVIVDFSFPAATLEAIADAGIICTVLDHHKTALENLATLSDRILQKFDMAECGATLTWKHYFPDKPVPPFLEYVRDRDLWDFLLPQTKEIHAALSHLRYQLKDFGNLRLYMLFLLFERLSRMNAAEIKEHLVPIGRPLIAEREARIEAIASRYEFIYFQNNDNWYVPVVYLNKDGSEDRFVSDVCMALYRQHPDAPFSACYLPSSSTWSLRSDKHGNNTDVSAIAKQFDGGGHLNASGFKENNSL